MTSVLISGASIAGPALAWWLARHGFKPTLVERSNGPRPGGHAIDVRGAGVAVLRRMGLEAVTRQRRTRLKGMSTIDAQGRETWRSEEMTITGGSFGSGSIEILRDDMSDILLGALPPDTEILYGDTVVGLSEVETGVEVVFDNAPARTFDLVIGADGIGSNIRTLLFGPDYDCLHPFDVALTAFSVPNHLGLEDWQLSYEQDDEKCLVYTARENRELRICMSIPAPFSTVPTDRPGQIAFVRKHCEGWRWEVPRLMSGLDAAPDFYLGAIGQVRAAEWSRGRVALVGDAAYCPSPYTGQGTSLAIVGASILASELAAASGDHGAAFAAYHTKMLPFVLKNQAIAQIALDARFGEPGYYANVLEPALSEAQDAIELDWF